MASPQAQDIAPRMRSTKSGKGGTGSAGRPFGRTKKAKGSTRRPAGKKAGARKRAGARAKKRR
jgi:hypothetical protein